MTQIPRSRDFPALDRSAQADRSDDWYLAQLRPNQFERARRNLVRQGFDCFMPFRPATRRTGRQMRTRLEPLFPGYLFLSLGPEQAWRSINGTYGVVRLVMRDAVTPQPVPRSVMAELLAHTDESGLMIPSEELAKGDTVRIHAGPMAGLVARVEGFDGPGRVGVLLEMMGQAVRATLPTEHAERVPR